jgi:hypothetical protein
MHRHAAARNRVPAAGAAPTTRDSREGARLPVAARRAGADDTVEDALHTLLDPIEEFLGARSWRRPPSSAIDGGWASSAATATQKHRGPCRPRLRHAIRACRSLGLWLSYVAVALALGWLLAHLASHG